MTDHTEPVVVLIELRYAAVDAEDGPVPMWHGRAIVDGERVDDVSSQTVHLLHGMAERIEQHVQPLPPRSAVPTRKGVEQAWKVLMHGE